MNLLKQLISVFSIVMIVGCSQMASNHSGKGRIGDSVSRQGSHPKSEYSDGFREPYSGDRTLYEPESGKCHLKAYVITGETGFDVFAAPDGKKIKTYVPSSDGHEYFSVNVTGHMKRWLSLQFADGVTGWIPVGIVRMNVLNNTSDSVTALRTRPEEDSPSVGDIFGPATVIIIGGTEGWALVEYHSPKGFTFTGWLNPIEQSATPVKYRK